MTETCRSCSNPLILNLDPEDSGDEAQEPSTVPDDLHLPCGCHFHWQCIMDEATSITATLTCPSCNSYLPPNTAGGSSSSSSQPTAAPQILTTYLNEGGLQSDLDIFPDLREEAFLTTHPAARPARALHSMVAEGDVQGIISLLSDVEQGGGGDDDDEAEGEEGKQEQHMTPSQLLTWRDPLNGGRTALHVALEEQQEEVVWLLLWMGSGVGRETFPPVVVQAAEGGGLPRGVVGPGEDVRFVRDEAGRAAEDVCMQLGPPWDRMVEGGLFMAGLS
ncbi:hypothetical protein VTK26DRAFT_9099 [Humicola hyalothermophila]